MYYYPFHIAEYRKDAGHLTPEEHYIYRWLIDEYFLDEKPITLDKRKLMRRMRLTFDQVEILDQVLQDFFIETEKGYKHTRIERELANWYEKSDKARVSAMKRWHPEMDQCEIDATVMRSHRKRNAKAMLLNTKDLIPKKETSELSFDEFWKVYPRKDNKKKAAVTWNRLSNKKRKLAFNDCQMRFIGREKQFIMMPTTYLNGERWNDDPPGEIESLGGRSNHPGAIV